MFSFVRFKIIILIIALVYSTVSEAQDLWLVNSNNLVMTGTSYLILTNNSITNKTTFKNNNNLNCKDVSTIQISSSGPAAISGGGISTFKNLIIDLRNTDLVHPNTLTLNSNITVSANLSFASDGLVDLNGKTITLGTASGQILNETNTARITGPNGGTVTKQINMSAPNPLTNVNFGNMGFVLSTTLNIGTVTVFRGHVLQQNSAGTGFGGVYRYFDIKTAFNPAGNNMTAKFSYLDAEVTKAPVDYTNNKSALTLWNNQESTRGIWLLSDRDSYDDTNNWVLKSSIPTFTTTSGVNFRFTLSSTTTKPLPVTLIYFTGSLINGSNNLKWSVSNDGSLHHFELEHSQDGVSFSKLSDILPGLSGSSVEEYTYIDQHPYSPASYYRLKVVDNTQKSFYSNVVKLKVGSDITASIFPNPASDHTYLSFSSLTDGNTSFQLFNTAGQLIRTKTISFHKGDNVIDISLANLPNGIYVVKSADLTIEHNMLIKN